MGDTKQADRRLRLARLNVGMEACEAERRALDAREQEILDRKIAVCQEILLEEKILQQRTWEVQPDYDERGYLLVADPSAGPWPAVDAILNERGLHWAVPLPVPGGSDVKLLFGPSGGGLISGIRDEDPDALIRALRALNLTVSGMPNLESKIQRECTRTNHHLRAGALLQEYMAEKEGPGR